MNEENLIKYYNKFNEDKRLLTRHGIIEFNTTIKYISKYIKPNDKIIDIGAGSGRYSKYFIDKGHDVTAVDLVKHNLKLVEAKSDKIKTYLANATNLSKFKDNSFNIVLLLGPMYHLISKEEKIKALEEAKRICSKDGYIFVQYCMNDFAIIKHGFMDGNILENKNIIDDNFHINPKETDLYSRLRLEDINELNKITNLKRIKIITPDGPTDYIRNYINKMKDEEFDLYYKYHLSTCERSDMLGCAAHTLDILKK